MWLVRCPALSLILLRMGPAVLPRRKHGRFRLLLRRDRRQARERHREFRFVVRLIDQLAGEIFAIGAHVEIAVAAEVEEDGLLLALLLAIEGQIDGGLDGVVRFRRGQDALLSGSSSDIDALPA